MNEFIEQNIDRLLNQNKILYLDNIINQKMEKEKENPKMDNDNNLLLKHYLSKWKKTCNNNRDKNSNNKLKNIFRKYTVNNWNKDIKDFIKIKIQLIEII